MAVKVLTGRVNGALSMVEAMKLVQAKPEMCTIIVMVVHYHFDGRWCLN